jgi:hypothetical protein
MTSGDLQGAKIFFHIDEPVSPALGPTNEYHYVYDHSHGIWLGRGRRGRVFFGNNIAVGLPSLKK